MRTTQRAFLLAVGILSAGACAPTLKHIDPATLVSGVDFRAHSKEGFLFTPNAYTGDFEPIGLVTISIYAEGNVVEDRNTLSGHWEFTKLDAQLALAAARKRAEELGGNAMANVSMRAITKTVPNQAFPVIVPGIEVSGFAIKRAR